MGCLLESNSRLVTGKKDKTVPIQLTRRGRKEIQDTDLLYIFAANASMPKSKSTRTLYIPRIPFSLENLTQHATGSS